MKKVASLLLSALLYIFLSSLFPKLVYARSGCCSHHGGVDCSAGSQPNGRVICLDGWRGSSCLYSEMVKCGGYSSPEQNTYLPTRTPTPRLTSTPTLKPTPTPTSRPTSTPTPKPTSTSTPTPNETSIPIDTPTLSPEVKGEGTEDIQGAEESEDSGSGMLLPLGALGVVGGYWFYKKRIK